jgi:hypothetical protein
MGDGFCVAAGGGVGTCDAARVAHTNSASMTVGLIAFKIGAPVTSRE